MTRVTILPAEIEIELKPGDTLMAGAQGLGLYWPTTCGGQAICTTCLTEVVSGADALAEMSRNERKTLVSERGEAILSRPLRLACQAVVVADGEITVKKAGVRAANEF
jgi:2Fe-2S ferredoxin